MPKLVRDIDGHLTHALVRSNITFTPISDEELRLVGSRGRAKLLGILGLHVLDMHPEEAMQAYRQIISSQSLPEFVNIVDGKGEWRVQRQLETDLRHMHATEAIALMVTMVQPRWDILGMGKGQHHRDLILQGPLTQIEIDDITTNGFFPCTLAEIGKPGPGICDHPPGGQGAILPMYPPIEFEDDMHPKPLPRQPRHHDIVRHRPELIDDYGPSRSRAAVHRPLATGPPRQQGPSRPPPNRQYRPTVAVSSSSSSDSSSSSSSAEEKPKKSTTKKVAAHGPRPKGKAPVKRPAAFPSDDEGDEPAHSADERRRKPALRPAADRPVPKRARNGVEDLAPQARLARGGAHLARPARGRPAMGQAGQGRRRGRDDDEDEAAPAPGPSRRPAAGTSNRPDPHHRGGPPSDDEPEPPVDPEEQARLDALKAANGYGQKAEVGKRAWPKDEKKGWH
ncbi:MAG: hypothetical protein Q9218_004360 [Villophora microphyllina]